VIVTRDRCDELRRALASAVSQGGEVDILVVDDGSTDGSTAMVQREFPGVHVERFDFSAGLVVRRSDAAESARGPIIISIDDDAVFSSRDIVAQTLRDFDHPRVAAVAIPYADIGSHPGVQQRAPDTTECWVAPTFRGTAYAVRRDVFIAVGGFRREIFHQGEEPDFSLRLLTIGYVVRLGRSDPVHHYESKTRDLARMAIYGRRNEILLAFTYFRAPLSIAMMVGYAFKGLLIGMRLRLVAPTIRGIFAGGRSCWAVRGERHPVSWRTAWLDRRLRHHGTLPLSLIENQLPPLPSAHNAGRETPLP
jgi:GT2 family glycosyltransferase